jgi:glycosyltransferase involved in cell wall biosynthesis
MEAFEAMTKHSIARVAHLTSVHSRYDTRIFVKQCRSLVANGYEVYLIVADGKGDEERDGVFILDTGRPRNRLERVFSSTRRVLRKAVSLDADVYQFHDPELMPAGLLMKWRGRTVVFDAHEDLPKQLLGKPYLGPIRLRMLAFLFSRFERFACKRLDAILTATPSIGEKFRRINPSTFVINNFPLLSELYSDEPWEERQAIVSYAGVISAVRGIREIVMAMGAVKSNARLALAGTFAESGTEEEVRSLSGWSRVDALGYIDRESLRRVLGDSVAGLVIFSPLPNHMDAQPNKMFEYMSAGVPIIVSDFPLWREIVDGAGCGICVDPGNPEEIAEAIDRLVLDSEAARRMGESGRRAIIERYNWPAEEKKLLGAYSKLLGEAA